MNGNTTLTAEDLYSEIEILQKALDGLKAKILKSMPVKYGSDAWWERETKKGLEELKQGKGKTFKSVNELEKYLGL